MHLRAMSAWVPARMDALKLFSSAGTIELISFIIFYLFSFIVLPVHSYSFLQAVILTDARKPLDTYNKELIMLVLMLQPVVMIKEIAVSFPL